MQGPWRPTPRKTTDKEWCQWLYDIGSRDGRMGHLKYFGFQMILLQVSDVGHGAARFTVLSSGFQPRSFFSGMGMFTRCFYVLEPCNLLFGIKGHCNCFR